MKKIISLVILVGLFLGLGYFFIDKFEKTDIIIKDKEQEISDSNKRIDELNGSIKEYEDKVVKYQEKLKELEDKNKLLVFENDNIKTKYRQIKESIPGMSTNDVDNNLACFFKDENIDARIDSSKDVINMMPVGRKSLWSFVIGSKECQETLVNVSMQLNEKDVQIGEYKKIIFVKDEIIGKKNRIIDEKDIQIKAFEDIKKTLGDKVKRLKKQRILWISVPAIVFVGLKLFVK